MRERCVRGCRPIRLSYPSDFKESGVWGPGGAISLHFVFRANRTIAADQGSLGSMMQHETESWNRTLRRGHAKLYAHKSNQQSPSRLSIRCSYLNVVSYRVSAEGRGSLAGDPGFFPQRLLFIEIQRQ